ncbi:MAG: hypothetical protein DME22_25355 [Verrucomicrobia bacterium]|nr:MAG: hypothetical protein DME22_25355 [Verrucomicrobiota bacterium]
MKVNYLRKSAGKVQENKSLPKLFLIPCTFERGTETHTPGASMAEGGKWTELITQRHNDPVVTPRSAEGVATRCVANNAAWDSVGVSENTGGARGPLVGSLCRIQPELDSAVFAFVRGTKTVWRSRAVLSSAPEHKISPEYLSQDGWKTRQVKPLPRHGVGNARQHRKLLYVQGLIRVSFHANSLNPDSPELFVSRHTATSTAWSKSPPGRNNSHLG